MIIFEHASSTFYTHIYTYTLHYIISCNTISTLYRGSRSVWFSRHVIVLYSQFHTSTHPAPLVVVGKSRFHFHSSSRFLCHLHSISYSTYSWCVIGSCLFSQLCYQLSFSETLLIVYCNFNYTFYFGLSSIFLVADLFYTRIT